MKKKFILSVLAIVLIPLVWMTYLFHAGNEVAIAYIIGVATLTTCFALVTLAAFTVCAYVAVCYVTKNVDSPEVRDKIFGEIKKDADFFD